MPKDFQTLLAEFPFKVGNFAHRLSEEDTTLCVRKIAKVNKDCYQDSDDMLIR